MKLRSEKVAFAIGMWACMATPISVVKFLPRIGDNITNFTYGALLLSAAGYTVFVFLFAKDDEQD